MCSFGARYIPNHRAQGSWFPPLETCLYPSCTLKMALGLLAQGLGLCPRLGGRPLPSGHPPVPYHWASQASWPVEPADFVAALKEVDMDAVREDLRVMFKTSQAFWPADYGNYAPFFVRLAWHNTGSYRTTDGRGGADGGRQR